MATDFRHMPSDVELLHEYLGQRLERLGPDEGDLSLDAALAGFQDYYRQLRDLRGKIRQAEQSLARGEGGPLDVEAVITRVRGPHWAVDDLQAATAALDRAEELLRIERQVDIADKHAYRDESIRPLREKIAEGDGPSES